MDIRSLKMDQFFQISDLHLFFYSSAVYLYRFLTDAGFGGISLGSTPTAMATMSAVTQRYGASHRAFIIVPLVAAFFIGLVNALLIPFFLATF